MKSHDHDHAHDIKVRSERLSPTRVRLIVELPSETLRDHEKAATARYASAARIPGFRPGKAPLKMIQERYRDEIRKEVVSHLLESGLSEAIDQTKLMPVNQPRVQVNQISFDNGKAFEFQAEFEVQPEIEIRDYKGVPVKPASVDVEDKDVQGTLDNLRERLAALEPLDAKKPETGNFAVVNIRFRLKDTPDFKEPAKPFTVELGAGTLLPEMEAGLLEMTVDETKIIESKFPEDHHDKAVAGKEVVYECQLLELKKKTLPELNDAFAAQLKDGATLAALTEEIRSDLKKSKTAEAERTRRRQLMEYLIQHNPFEVPASMVEQQMRMLYSWMQDDAKKRGMDLGELNESEVDSLRKRAEEMVKGSLLLKEIAVKEKIALDEIVLNSRVAEIAQQLNRSLDETKKMLSGKGMLDRLQDEVLTDQIYEFLFKNAQAADSAPTA